MKVRELIAELQKFDPEADVITNECEATAAHEEVGDLSVVGLTEDRDVYVGTYDVRARTYRA